MLELVIIAVYFAVMIAVGVVSRRRARGADDFFVAGRRGSSLFITGSLLATIVGGSAIMVTSNLGFTRGLTGAWWLLVGVIGLVVLGFFLAKKVREFGLYRCCLGRCYRCSNYSCREHNERSGDGQFSFVDGGFYRGLRGLYHTGRSIFRYSHRYLADGNNICRNL